MLKSTISGNYPKLPTQRGDVNIRRVLHRFDQGEIDQKEVENAYEKVTARVVNEQIEAGIDLPTDGQIRWDDIVTPFAGKVGGFEINGLIRWFDNNVYYRKPVIVDDIKWREPVAAPAYKQAASLTAKPLKAVLPGPYSFVMLSENKHYAKRETLLKDMATMLREEVNALIQAGCRQIQFDEPCLADHPEDCAMAADAVNGMIKDFPGLFWINFYFQSIDKIAKELERFKVNVLSVDCVSAPGNFEILLQYASHVLPVLDYSTREISSLKTRMACAVCTAGLPSAIPMLTSVPRADWSFCRT